MKITMVSPFRGRELDQIPIEDLKKWLTIVENKYAKRRRMMGHHKEEIEAIKKRTASTF